MGSRHSVINHRIATTTRIGFLLIAAPLVGSLSGCFADTDPAVQILGATLTQRTDQGVVIDVTIQGANHTNKDLKLRRVDYWMDLDGVRVFEGSRSPQTTFSALGAQTFSVPAAAAIELVPQALEAPYRVGATITYLLPGPLAKAFFDLGIHRTRVTAQGAGVVQLRPENEKDTTPPKTGEPKPEKADSP